MSLQETYIVVVEKLEALCWKVTEMKRKITKDTSLVRRGAIFNKEEIADELPAHFRTPMYLSACNGTSDTLEHPSKFENPAFLHQYMAGVKC